MSDRPLFNRQVTEHLLLALALALYRFLCLSIILYYNSLLVGANRSSEYLSLLMQLLSTTGGQLSLPDELVECVDDLDVVLVLHVQFIVHWKRKR